jgi:hypothetical protein
VEAAPHFLGHACREIEGGLRSVLRGVARLPELPRGQDEGHRRDIERILDSLEVPHTDPVAELWLSLPRSEYALDAAAHRRGQLGIRTDMGPALTLWDQFQAILDLALDRLEATSNRSFDVIDDLLDTPTTESLRQLEDTIPQNQMTIGHFFDRAGPEWIPVLRDCDYLRPDEVPDDRGGVVRWPAGRWLVKLAPDHPDFVADVLTGLGSTINRDAARSALEATLLLPDAKLVTLADQVAAWTRLDLAGDLSELGSKIAARLAGSGNADVSLRISREALGTGRG